MARTVKSTYLLLSYCYIKHISFLSNHIVILWKMISDKNVLHFKEHCVDKDVFGVPQICITFELLFVIIWSPSVPDKECNDGHAPRVFMLGM